MKIAIIHGYLLSGTGSNIYVANLTAGLVGRGHEVFLFCQEPNAEAFSFIDECYDFEADNRRFFPVFRRNGNTPGRARLFRPRIGGILPVYVIDDYLGFTAREFHRLPLRAIDNYVARTARAVKTVHQSFGFEVAQANHVIASPAVARRALESDRVPYHVTIHGSALNYCVKKDSRLDGLALYGLERAASVSTSSRWLGRELNDYLADLGRRKLKVNIIYPGVELALFKPAYDRPALARGLIEKLGAGPALGKSAGLKEALRITVRGGDRAKIDAEIKAPAAYDRRAPDRDFAQTINKIDWQKEHVVMLVGKYLAAKGLHAAILAAPLVRARIPDARFLAVGFGDEREQFEALAAALAGGDGELVCELVAAIEENEQPRVGLEWLASLKRSRRFDAYIKKAVAGGLDDAFLFSGPLNHEELALLVPMATLSLSPSIFPEAFGMVAVEALAAGVYPILTDAFGMAEIAKMVRLRLGPFIDGLPRLKLDERFVQHLSRTITAALQRPSLRNSRFKNAAHSFALDTFDWKRVVDDYLDLFNRLEGRLKESKVARQAGFG